jgi:hypothetical protein
MKKSVLNLSLLLLIGFIAVATACRKDTNTSAEQAIAEDITAHNDITELVTADADLAIDGFSGEIDERNDCPTVTSTVPFGTWPNTITLDYSEAGCTKNGRTFQGKIIVNQSGPIKTQGTTRVLTFDQFFFEGVQVTGTKSIVNAGSNAAGQLFWNVSVTETLTFPDGTTSSYQSERVRTLVDGVATPARADDVWNITGASTGTNRHGVAYAATITTPLVKRFGCPWISEGAIEFVANSKTRTLDFGDGTCDRDAVLTLADGTEKDIKIKHRWW